MTIEDSNYAQEEQDLNRTRQVRSDIINEFTKDGVKVTDLESTKVLLTVLNDSDKSSLGRMKIKSEDKNNATNSNTASIIASFLTKVSAGAGFNGTSTASIPELPADIPAPVILPGETDIGVRNTNFDEFSKVHFKQQE